MNITISLHDHAMKMIMAIPLLQAHNLLSSSCFSSIFFLLLQMLFLWLLLLLLPSAVFDGDGLMKTTMMNIKVMNSLSCICVYSICVLPLLVLCVFSLDDELNFSPDSLF